VQARVLAFERKMTASKQRHKKRLTKGQDNLLRLAGLKSFNLTTIGPNLLLKNRSQIIHSRKVKHNDLKRALNPEEAGVLVRKISHRAHLNEFINYIVGSIWSSNMTLDASLMRKMWKMNIAPMSSAKHGLKGKGKELPMLRNFSRARSLMASSVKLVPRESSN
jgi:hypothetical protein